MCIATALWSEIFNSLINWWAVCDCTLFQIEGEVMVVSSFLNSLSLLDWDITIVTLELKRSSGIFAIIWLLPKGIWLFHQVRPPPSPCAKTFADHLLPVAPQHMHCSGNIFRLYCILSQHHAKQRRLVACRDSSTARASKQSNHPLTYVWHKAFLCINIPVYLSMANCQICWEEPSASVCEWVGQK